MSKLKIRFAAPIMVGVFISCTLAVALVQHRTGSYTPQNLGQIAQPAPASLAEGSQYEVAAYPAFDVELAEGTGRGQVQVYCGSCHTTRYIPMQPLLPAAIWEAEVQKMVKTYGAQIPDPDAQKIIQYLQSHYTR